MTVMLAHSRNRVRTSGVQACPTCLSRSHSRTKVSGEPPAATAIGFGWSDVLSYADRLNNQVEALNEASERQIVSVDPFKLDEVAKGYDGSSLTAELADSIRAESAKLKERAKARGPEQVKRDLAWSDQWAPFMNGWREWFKLVTTPRTFGNPPGLPDADDSWRKNQAMESKYRELFDAYQKIGSVVSPPPPPESLEAPSGLKKDEYSGIAGIAAKAKEAAGAIAAPVTGIAVVAVAGVALYAMLKK